MQFELRPLGVDDGRDVYDMLQEIPQEENGFVNGLAGKSFEEYRRWLGRCDEVARGIGLEPWQVPQSTYWLYADGVPVGYGKVRHRLTDGLRAEGGHIGYAVRPSARGRGCGRLLLKMLLAEARKLGVRKALVTIRVGNAPSLRVALANGGVVERTENERHYVWILTPRN